MMNYSGNEVSASKLFAQASCHRTTFNNRGAQFFLHTISLRFFSFHFRDFGEVIVIEMVVDYCGYWIFDARRSKKSCHKNLYPLLCKYDILLHAFYAFCPKTFRILYSISFGERM